MESVPLSSVCPDCGAMEFKKVAAQRWIAFANDRVCKRCGTRYALPTPRWAGIVFVVLGAGFFLTGAILMLGNVMGLLEGDGKGSPFGFILAGGLVALGAAAGLHGIRALFFPGSV